MKELEIILLNGTKLSRINLLDFFKNVAGIFKKTKETIYKSELKK
ncbi:hypothetical protein [Campylobacter showae]|nr:hypothetical protein [Campylobacter showae]